MKLALHCKTEARYNLVKTSSDTYSEPRPHTLQGAATCRSILNIS